MEFIFTPVSFKGTISAQRITELLEQASRKHFPQAKTHAVPVADGGVEFGCRQRGRNSFAAVADLN